MRNLLLNASAAIFGLLLLFVLLEGGMRVAGIGFPDFIMVDEHRGFAHRPGAAGWWRREGEAFVRINSDGLRDEEHPVQPPPNTLRVAVLGDSYAEALQVPQERNVSSELERRLARCPALDGRAVEVLNFGVSSYGTAQELLTLRHHAWKYRPDMVVLAFFTGNDVRNNSRELEYDATIRPFYRFEGDRLVRDDSFRETPWYLSQTKGRGRLVSLALHHSRVLQVANAARQNLAARRAARSAPADGRELGLDDEIYRAPDDARWEEAWRITEALLDSVRHEVEQHGSELLVVTLSNGIQVHPDRAVREEFRRRLGVEDLFYPDRRVADAGARDGYRVLSLAPAFQRYAEENGAFLHGFDGKGEGHWNETGHALAGRAIADALCPSAAGES